MPLEIARVTGVQIWNHLLGTIRVRSLLLTGAVEKARALLSELASQSLHGAHRLGDAHLTHLEAYASLLAGDLPNALEQATSAEQTIASLGAFVPTALSRLLLAEILLDRGEISAAEVLIGVLREQARSAQSAFVEAQVELFSAVVARARRDRPADERHLAKAFSLAERFGPELLRTFLTRPESFARHCAAALAAGIQPETVRSSLRGRPWGDFVPPASLVGWPWQVEVRLFGTFRVRLDGRPVVAERKRQTRVLELLQLLVVEGGTAPEHRIADELWPDADGDNAEHALSITLHRLRGFLGDASLVVRRNGTVTLDRSRVFADVWAIEHLLDEARAARQAKDEARAHANVEEARALFVGMPEPIRRDATPRWLSDAGRRWSRTLQTLELPLTN